MSPSLVLLGWIRRFNPWRRTLKKRTGNTVTVRFRVSPELKVMIESAAKYRGVTLSEFVRISLRDWCK